MARFSERGRRRLWRVLSDEVGPDRASVIVDAVGAAFRRLGVDESDDVIAALTAGVVDAERRGRPGVALRVVSGVSSGS